MSSTESLSQRTALLTTTTVKSFIAYSLELEYAVIDVSRPGRGESQHFTGIAELSRRLFIEQLSVPGEQCQACSDKTLCLTTPGISLSLHR